MLEIRWHGRGGQGAKTASLLLADVALHLSDDFEPGRGGVPLRRRLLVGPAVLALVADRA